MQQAVEQLIAREIACLPPHASAPTAYEPFQNNPLLRAEWDRVCSTQSKLSALDKTRYELAPPADTAALDQWRNAVNNAHAQLLHQKLRLENLELMQEHCTSQWKKYNDMLETRLEILEGYLKEVKKASTATNKQRKAAQLQVGEELEYYGERWKQLVTQNLQLELACAALETEIEQLSNM